MVDPNSLDDDFDSIFDEPLDAVRDALEVPRSRPAGDGASSLDLSSLSTDELPEPAFDVSELVAEWSVLDRRRSQANPPLSDAELVRWQELRESFEYAFGSASPPLGGSRRRVLRVPTHLKARISGGSEALATLRNLSGHGAFLELIGPVPLGATLGLEIEAGSGAPVLSVEGIVKWCREIGNMDGPAGVGVEFSAIEDSDRALLEALVEGSLAAASAKRG